MGLKGGCFKGERSTHNGGASETNEGASRGVSNALQVLGGAQPELRHLGGCALVAFCLPCPLVHLQV